MPSSPPTSFSGNDIIAEALTVLGVMYPGQTVGANAQLTGQNSLNNLLAEWSAQALAVFSIQRFIGSLSPGTTTYTIGTGQNFNTTRPERIEAWAAYGATGPAGAGKPVDAATFVALAKDRSASGYMIQALIYDAEYPNGNITIYPQPNAYVTTLELWMWVQFTAISDFTAVVSFPPGYVKALVYNLAVDLGPKFGRPITPDVQRIADQTKATLGSTNVTTHAQPVTDAAPQTPPQPAQ
jgi:hypothetical protein